MDKSEFIPRYLEYAENNENIIDIKVLEGYFQNIENKGFSYCNEVRIVDKDKFDLEKFINEIDEIAKNFETIISIFGDINYISFFGKKEI